MNILMVCLGNICRSPLAEGIMRSKLGKEYFVDSAGTGSWHVGQAPDKRSIAVAKKYGIEISHLRARQFQVKDFDEFDYILAMDSSNYRDILSLARSEEDRMKVRLISRSQPRKSESNRRFLNCIQANFFDNHHFPIRLVSNKVLRSFF